MTPAEVTTTPAVTDPPSDLQDGRRLWPWMFERAKQKNKLMPAELHELLHQSLKAYDAANAPGVSESERYEHWATYFRTQARLGLIEESKHIEF